MRFAGQLAPFESVSALARGVVTPAAALLGLTVSNVPTAPHPFGPGLHPPRPARRGGPGTIARGPAGVTGASACLDWTESRPHLSAPWSRRCVRACSNGAGSAPAEHPRLARDRRWPRRLAGDARPGPGLKPARAPHARREVGLLLALHRYGVEPLAPVAAPVRAECLVIPDRVVPTRTYLSQKMDS